MEGFVLENTEPRKASGAEIIAYSERGRRNVDDVEKSKSTMLCGIVDITGRNQDLHILGMDGCIKLVLNNTYVCYIQDVGRVRTLTPTEPQCEELVDKSNVHLESYQPQSDRP